MNSSIAIRSKPLVALAKRTVMITGSSSLDHQFRRACRHPKFVWIRLGRIVRDINRKFDGDLTLASTEPGHTLIVADGTPC